VLEIALKYTNIFHAKALKNVLELGFLVGKYMYHLATLELKRKMD
jgi:hypothetical protein